MKIPGFFKILNYLKMKTDNTGISHPNQKPVVVEQIPDDWMFIRLSTSPELYLHPAPGNAVALFNPLPGYKLKPGYLGAAIWLDPDADKILKACPGANYEKVQAKKIVSETGSVRSSQ